MSPFTGKKVEPSNKKAICDNLLHGNFVPSFEKFSILAHENKKYLSKIKKGMLIMREKPSLNFHFIETISSVNALFSSIISIEN